MGYYCYRVKHFAISTFCDKNCYFIYRIHSLAEEQRRATRLYNQLYKMIDFINGFTLNRNGVLFSRLFQLKCSRQYFRVFIFSEFYAILMHKTQLQSRKFLCRPHRIRYTGLDCKQMNIEIRDSRPGTWALRDVLQGWMGRRKDG